jgi:hypothetical protein
LWGLIHMAGKNVTLKEVEQKFAALNPKGYITFKEHDKHNAYVSFEGKKEYKYSFSTPHELAQKLNVLTYSDKMNRKGFRQLSCTCWTDEKVNYRTCVNCGSEVDPAGQERESLFGFLFAQ